MQGSKKRQAFHVKDMKTGMKFVMRCRRGNCVWPITTRCCIWMNAGREWRRNPDLFSSYHQPMSMLNALFHSLVDMVIFCVDFPVPNMKFIALNDDQTYSEIICNRYTGELIVDPRYFGTSNFCTDAPMGMLRGSLTTKEHVMFDVKTHEKYGE